MPSNCGKLIAVAPTAVKANGMATTSRHPEGATARAAAVNRRNPTPTAPAHGPINDADTSSAGCIVTVGTR